MHKIDNDVLAQLLLAEIGKVVFYKRDELTTDLICCDVTIAEQVWSFHEELSGWNILIEHLQGLPNFRPDWLSSVSHPPFVASETIAFCR